jgi:hypothetical protein
VPPITQWRKSGNYALGLSAGIPNGNAGWANSYGDNLGIRLTGVLVPTETGTVDFFIRSDDGLCLLFEYQWCDHCLTR